MASETPTVADIFRRAQAIRAENTSLKYSEIQARITAEFKDKPFPPAALLTIPEQDALAPEEDWTAGLPIVLRGIQLQDWNEVAAGIVLCLEQTENYQREHGGVSDRDRWHDRTEGIEEALGGVQKWMPEELVALTGKASRS